MGFEATKMQIIEGEVNKGAFLMGDVSAEIFATDYVVAIPQSAVQFLLDDACDLAVFLGLGYAGDIGHFLDGGVGNTDHSALILGGHIREANQHLLGAFRGSVFVLFKCVLLFTLIRHFSYINYYSSTHFIPQHSVAKPVIFSCVDLHGH